MDKNTNLKVWKDLWDLRPFYMARRIMELNNELMWEKQPSLAEVTEYVLSLEKSKKDLEAAKPKDRWLQKLKPKILGELTKEINKWSKEAEKLKSKK